MGGNNVLMKDSLAYSTVDFCAKFHHHTINCQVNFQLRWSIDNQTIQILKVRHHQALVKNHLFIFCEQFFVRFHVRPGEFSMEASEELLTTNEQLSFP